jgi:putative transposase
VARREAAAVAAGLRAIYTAPGEEAALDALAAFSASPLGQKYPQAVRVWEDAWDAFTPFLAFSPPVRRLLYTTNSIVTWSPRGVVFHVDHEGLRGRVLPGGRGYLPLSITRISRRSNACSAGANARLVA